MALLLLQAFLLWSGLQWLTVESSLEVKPYFLLVTANATLMQETLSNDEKIFNEGSINEATLSCLEVMSTGLTARPQEEVVWFQNENKLDTAGHKYKNMGKKRSLMIRSLMCSDSGVYECAMNSNLTKRGRAELWVAPQILAAPERQTLYLDSRMAIITCLVPGGMRTVEWRKDNQTIASSNDTKGGSTGYTVLPSGSLQLSNVSESAEGEYVCQVSNRAGEDERYIQVEIQQKLQLTEKGCILQQEPEDEFTSNLNITSIETIDDTPRFAEKPPSCVRAKVGFTTTLRCSAIGMPQPVITWTKGKKHPMIIEEGDRHSLLPDGSLRITSLDKGDRGIYTCKASIGRSTTSASVRLDIETMNEVCGKVEVEGEEEEMGSATEQTAGDRVRRIVGGEPKHIRYWPWQVLVQYSPALLRTYTNLFEEPLCGGALIHPLWIVTAAHCVYSSRSSVRSLTADQVMVRAGVFNRTDTTEPYQQRLEVAEIIKHPKFLGDGYGPPDLHHDIALLRLARPVKPTSHVGFICLPSSSSSSDPRPGTRCVVTGWGHKEFQARVSPEILHSVEVPVVSRSQCTSEKAYSNSFISRTTLCAGLTEGGADACQNDSGGPLACPNAEGQWTLHGVVSRGTDCGRPHKYGIYARVTRFVRWINSVIS